MEGLWKFAQDRYARPGVASLCLRLQEQWDADINLLLAGAWLAERSRGWGRDDAAQLAVHCRDWRERYLLPQRAIRRSLRGLDDELYRQALALELMMEQRQLALIERWLTAGLLQAQAALPDADGVAVRANLQAAIMAGLHPDVDDGWASDLDELASLLQ